MVHHTQKVKNATCDWFCADGSHIASLAAKCSNSDKQKIYRIKMCIAFSLLVVSSPLQDDNMLHHQTT